MQFVWETFTFDSEKNPLSFKSWFVFYVWGLLYGFYFQTQLITVLGVDKFPFSSKVKQYFECINHNYPLWSLYRNATAGGRTGFTERSIQVGELGRFVSQSYQPWRPHTVLHWAGWISYSVVQLELENG